MCRSEAFIFSTDLSFALTILTMFLSYCHLISLNIWYSKFSYFVLFQNSLAILCRSHIHITYIISLSSSGGKTHWEFDWNCIDSNWFGDGWHFLRWNLLIQNFGIYLHLFKYTFMAVTQFYNLFPTCFTHCCIYSYVLWLDLPSFKNFFKLFLFFKWDCSHSLG